MFEWIEQRKRGYAILFVCPEHHTGLSRSLSGNDSYCNNQSPLSTRRYVALYPDHAARVHAPRNGVDAGNHLKQTRTLISVPIKNK
jgi:hypothetical protein